MSNLKTFRHEFKYYINYFEYESLRRRLKHVLKGDKFSNNIGEYHIRSLYFDDVHNSALYEKQAGILSRVKFRIRIYNLNDSVIKLEKKSRVGQFIRKESAIISKFEYFKIVNKDFDFLMQSDNKLLNEFYFNIKAKKLRPDVIVDYVREAYTSKLSNIRITFDKKLQTGLNNVDIFDNSIPTVDVIEKPLYILEVKYDINLDSYFRSKLNQVNARYSKSSKYINCMLLPSRNFST